MPKEMEARGFTKNGRDILRALETNLRNPLPGPEVQSRMAPEPRLGHRPFRDVEDSCLKAGVLALVYPRDGHPHILLTRRTETVLTHRGQISLPGGARHPGEALQETALREASEELGIGLRPARVLGCLTPLYVPISNYCIYPTVVRLPRRPAFSPQPEEVAEILEVPLEHLLDPAVVRRETWDILGFHLSVPFYEFRGHKIWGATAMVLAELLEVIRG